MVLDYIGYNRNQHITMIQNGMNSRNYFSIYNMHMYQIIIHNTTSKEIWTTQHGSG